MEYFHFVMKDTVAEQCCSMVLIKCSVSQMYLFSHVEWGGARVKDVLLIRKKTIKFVEKLRTVIKSNSAEGFIQKGGPPWDPLGWSCTLLSQLFP